VKVEVAGGGFGWGESGVVGREIAVKGAVEHYAQFLVGQSATNIGALWQQMYRSQYFEGGRILTGAISAIDIALHDALAKHLGVPVYQLLGGAHRKEVPCFATVHSGRGEVLRGRKLRPGEVDAGLGRIVVLC
jgi:galactonate dehydratase